MVKNTKNVSETSSQEGEFQGGYRIFREVPVERILTDPRNPRRIKDIDSDDVLFRHLEASPVIQEPLIVEQTSVKDGGTYLLIDGERRYRAAVKAGFATVPCDVRKNLTEGERDLIKAIKNFGKDRWHVVDEVQFIAQKYEDWKNDKKRTYKKDGTLVSEKTRMQQFCEKFDIGNDALNRMIVVSKNDRAKQLVKEGTPLYDAYLTVLRESPTSVETSERVIQTAASYDTTISAQRGNSRSAKKGSVSTRKKSPAPSRSSLKMARQTVRAEIQQTPEDQDNIARTNILDWLGKAATFNATIRTNIPLLSKKESIRAVIDMIQAQIQVYQEFLSTINSRSKIGGRY